MILTAYYIIGIFVLFSLLSQLMRYRDVHYVSNWYIKYKKITGKNPNIDDFRKEKDFYVYISRNFQIIFESFWLLFGLITNDWVLFIILLFMNNLTIIFLESEKMFKNELLSKFLYVSILSVKKMIYIFIIVNYFHFKIDLNSLVIDFLRLR